MRVQHACSHHQFKRQGLSSPELFYDATNGNNPFGNLLTNGKMLGTAGTQVAPATGSILTPGRCRPPLLHRPAAPSSPAR